MLSIPPCTRFPVSFMVLGNCAPGCIPFAPFSLVYWDGIPPCLRLLFTSSTTKIPAIPRGVTSAECVERQRPMTPRAFLFLHARHQGHGCVKTYTEDLSD